MPSKRRDRVNDVTSASGERAGRARRWCTRLLVTAGGALATTAAAWAIGTATADAAQDEGSWLGGAEVADLERSAGNQATGVQDAVRAVQDDDAGRTARAGDPAERAEAAEERVDAYLEDLFGPGYEPPAAGDSPAWDAWRDRVEEWVEAGSAGDVPEFPIDDLPELDLPDETATPNDPSGAHAPDATVLNIVGFPSDAVTNVTQRGTSPRGTPGDADGSSDSPSTDLPMQLPAGAPAAPTSGSAAGAGADSAPVAIDSPSLNASAATAALEAISGALGAPMQLGRQPGVTPD